MSVVKKVFLLLLSFVGLVMFSVYSYEYDTTADNNVNKLVPTSTFEEYTTKLVELKNTVLSKVGLNASEKEMAEKQPLNLQLIKKDGVILMNGVFKDEKQAKEVAELLNINREGEFKFESNRVKDVMLLNKLSSLIPSFKDFFTNGSKLTIEEGTVLLNGELRDANYRALFDSIVSRSKIDIVSNIKEPSLSDSEEIIINERTEESKALVDNEIKDGLVTEAVNQDVKSPESNETTIKDEVKEEPSSEKNIEKLTEIIKNDDSSNLSQKSKQIQSSINSILSKKKINFKRRSTTITKDSYVAVKEISLILKENPNIKVEIAGHTDSRGKASLNKRISQDRANSVKTALIALGVDKSRLSAVGYGEDFPIAKDDANGLSEVNRRVEFNITGE